MSSECSGPKGCPKKKLELDFWGRGQNPIVQIAKKKLKDILNNLQSNYKAQATATFSISALISEIWALKAKKCWYFWNKGPDKKWCTVQKSLGMCLLVLGGKFDFFWETQSAPVPVESLKKLRPNKPSVTIISVTSTSFEPEAVGDWLERILYGDDKVNLVTRQLFCNNLKHNRIWWHFNMILLKSIYVYL